MKTITIKLDSEAKTLAKTLLLTEGQLVVKLGEMRTHRCFLDMGYQGVFEYCEVAGRGGLNEAPNLQLLCSGHHRFIHSEQGGEFQTPKNTTAEKDQESLSAIQSERRRLR